MSVLTSVVIPTYERAEPLAACLAGVSRSTLASDQFEVLVVDDGSSQPVEPVAARFGARYLRKANAGPGPARNFGVAHARSNLIVFLDDDCVPTAEWLAALVTAHQAHPDDAIYGSVVNGLRSNPFSEASQQILEYIYEYLERYPRGVDDSTFTVFATTNNLALSRALFERTGGFDPAFRLAAGEDREFCARWMQQGLALRHVPEALIHHYHHLSLRSFWRQHFSYGIGSQQMRRLRTTAKRRIEPPAFYLSLLTHPFREGISLRTLTISGAIALSQAAMAAGVVREATSRSTN